MIPVGNVYAKQPNGRKAQVTAITHKDGRTYAVMYWPDRDTETHVALDRLNTNGHWRLIG